MGVVPKVVGNRFRQRGAFGRKTVQCGNQVISRISTGQVTTTYTYSRADFGGNVERCWDELHPGPPYKTGGHFLYYDSYDETHEVKAFKSAYTDQSGLRYTLNTGFMPRNWPTALLTGSDLTGAGFSGKYSGNFGDPSSLGALAWSKYAPKQSTSDLGQFLGESREIPQMLRSSAWSLVNSFRHLAGSTRRRESKKIPDRVAGEYLNTQFGWIPFLRDLVSFEQTYRNCDRRLRQLRRDNGQWIRRGGLVSSITSEPVLISQSGHTPGSYSSNVYPQVATSGFFDASGLRVRSRIYYRTVETTWFRGAFRYWVPAYESDPKLDSRMRTLANYLRLYGARISPELVWNLTPWSWLADWVGNVGNIMTNLTLVTQDNVTAKYAYLMKTTADEYVNETDFFWKTGLQTVKWRRGCTSKMRRAASPFGFSIDVPDLSAYQWSILAALGLSRSKLFRSYKGWSTT